MSNQETPLEKTIRLHGLKHKIIDLFFDNKYYEFKVSHDSSESFVIVYEGDKLTFEADEGFKVERSYSDGVNEGVSVHYLPSFPAIANTFFMDLMRRKFYKDHQDAWRSQADGS